ncbi:hypothetical protein KL911_000193 [Ogataea haglerorum]|uniref:uncharacterized protein n=1 Tax=Ogataea haglerorum TaxID=1937702 RepID=UPI001C899EBD|nr:uncharacterized protein KL911_000193 [Ogataea haglerorum]KAG7700613.1 hypothetical protein KL951_000728 [Ogataea haglerorum]KAG7748463.1 hypothetical protein KL912_002368 [Ogataea haglerorum]KAG7759056.1 hypothetical protein KL911_000193 [Ogataea haglerorum]
MSDRYELLQYLKTVECEDYIDLFVANDIKIDLLPQLDRHALKEIGITKVGDRLRLQVLIHLLNAERLKSRVNVSDLAEVVSNASATLSSVDKAVTYNDKSRRSSDTFKVENEYRNCVTIIGPDGHRNEVNVTGCFSSTSIKKKAVRKMGIPTTHVEEWKAYYVDEDDNLHMMFDAEFTALCHSPDRPEKKRIILCHSSEAPSEAALATSKSISTTAGSDKQTLKNFLGQRPPSQLISTNLGEYFPDTGATELREVMRNSVRFSMYSSKMSTQQSTRESIYSGRPQFTASSVFSYGVAVPVKHTVGDVILNHSAALDTLRADQPPDLEDDGTIRASMRNVSLDKNGSLDSMQRARMSVAFSKRENRDSTVIKLFDDDDDDESFESSEQLSFSGQDNGGPSVWHKGTKIGQGSFGTVYLGLNGLTGELMAVKQVSLPRSSEDTKQTMVNALKQELSLLRVMNHENIVRYLGSSADSDNIYIFLEYIPGGSVSSMLSTYGPFEEPLVRNFITQVLIGLKYLHGEDIIHRDIKGANILIDIDGTVKISDFGISKKIDINDTEQEDIGTTKQQKRASLQGSVYWMAPEVVKQIAYTDKADIWSLGCLIVEMLTGKHPYPGFSQMQALFRIGTLTLPDIPDGVTDDCRDFLTMTFETDYKKRCNAARLLKHPFITPLLSTKR